MPFPWEPLAAPKKKGHFARCIKQLVKTCPSVVEDIERVLTGKDPTARADKLIGVGRDVLKIRVPSSDMNKGKSRGFRVLVASTLTGKWQPIAVYAKKDTEDLGAKMVRGLIESEVGDDDDEEIPLPEIVEAKDAPS